VISNCINPKPFGVIDRIAKRIQENRFQKVLDHSEGSLTLATNYVSFVENGCDALLLFKGR
jgi:hypothetical protein